MIHHPWVGALTGEGERGGVVGGLGVARAAVAGGGERRDGEEEEEAADQ